MCFPGKIARCAVLIPAVRWLPEGAASRYQTVSVELDLVWILIQDAGMEPVACYKAIYRGHRPLCLLNPFLNPIFGCVKAIVTNIIF